MWKQHPGNDLSITANRQGTGTPHCNQLCNSVSFSHMVDVSRTIAATHQIGSDGLHTESTPSHSTLPAATLPRTVLPTMAATQLSALPCLAKPQFPVLPSNLAFSKCSASFRISRADANSLLKWVAVLIMFQAWEISPVLWEPQGSFLITQQSSEWFMSAAPRPPHLNPCWGDTTNPSGSD